MSVGHSRTNFPTRKNVAFALCFASRLRSFGVIAGFGPSSNVIANLFGASVRQSVGPKSCARGYAAPYAANPAIPAAIAADDSIIHEFIVCILSRPLVQCSFSGSTYTAQITKCDRVRQFSLWPQASMERQIPSRVLLAQTKKRGARCPHRPGTNHHSTGSIRERACNATTRYALQNHGCVGRNGKASF